MAFIFEWHPAKATLNVTKHGVTFEEASTVLGDPLEVTVEDEEHLAEEARYFSLGLSHAGRLLAVSYTEREGRVRIISGRPATPHERRKYENQG